MVVFFPSLFPRSAIRSRRTYNLRADRYPDEKSFRAGIRGCGILVPESALEKIGEEDMLYRVVDGVAIRTLVTVGTRKDGNVEIITGVNEDDLVITGGQSNVLDGRAVSIQDGHSTEEIAKAMQQLYQKMRKK